MWLEVYRWYNTRLLGDHNLLLERRSAPRFEQLKVIGHMDMPITKQLDFSKSNQAVFWTMRCGTGFTGTIQKMLLDIPEVAMRLGPEGTRFRIVPEVMESPILAKRLPSTVSEFASVLGDAATPTPQVSTIDFEGPGASSYGPVCQVEFLAP